MFPRLAHRTRIAAIGVLAVAALGLTACTGGNGSAGPGNVDEVDKGLAANIDQAVESAMQLSGSTQAIVGVWDGKSGTYLHGYGDGVDGNTRFRGAQSTQPVVCALLLDTVHGDAKKLDRKVSKDLTRQSGIGDVTYRQLCDMRSGLADYKGAYADIFANNPTRPWPEQELIAQGVAHSPLSWPGLDFHQSDTNAVLLGRALGVKAGQDLGTLLADHVFSPAGMGSTYYPASDSTTVSGASLDGLTYPSSGGAPVCDVEPVKVDKVSPTMLAGAGGTVTTATDLKNFYEKYLSGSFGDDKKIVTDTLPTANPERDEAGNPTNEPEPADPQWAFGMEKTGPLYGRSGAITGTLSAAYHDPASGFTVVVALNNSSAGAGFARALAFELAALSTAGGMGPELPWSADDQAQALAGAAICQAPPEQAPAE